MPVTVEQFADVSNDILAAAMEPDRWQQVVDSLGRVLGPQVCTQIMGYDLETSAAPLAYASGYDPEILELYQEHYLDENPYALNFEAMKVGQVASSTELCPAEVMKKTGFYADLLRPSEDIYYGGGTLLLRDENRMFLFGGNMRAKDQEGHEQRWLSLCARIAPIMRQSLEINRMISGLSFEKWAADQHKLGSQTAVVLVDPEMRIHYASSEAERLIERGEPIQTSLGGKLRLTSSSVQTCIAQLARLQSKGKQSVFRSWHIDGERGQSWTCRAIGLCLGDMDRSPFGAFFDRSTAALLLALKAEAPVLEIGGVVQSTLGLSQVEAEIALLLADGMTAAEVASHRSVSIHTVRNQIKSALSKSGCRRQADLVMAVEKLRMSGSDAPNAGAIT
ncbi:helix-turn-helix transcriptional regulator [Labrenzia sp. PHM005]|uniref:helix-turn-helix transcriptional regulator n=1 Tax=Labrenzia sp. PHM005 TaxID=2590016 RepID=UPI0011404BF2|nr:helix-turn-helix transcriptional regulator [Labrenzia sp. PHM005]QDG78355.1 helix-turn-helix transcriptional regulator [Labrenzia sp. PHM005]